jgi:hypothetical protein
MRTNRNDEPQSIALLRKTLRYALTVGRGGAAEIGEQRGGAELRL